jgi:hypothetical protein
LKSTRIREWYITPGKVHTPPGIKNCFITEDNLFVTSEKIKLVSVIALETRLTNSKVLIVKANMNVTHGTPWRMEIVS